MLDKLFVKLLISILQLYKKFISPYWSKKRRCRFHPTCSEYSKQAFLKYGAKKGLIKTIYRLKRCRPDNYESVIDYP